MIDTNRKKLTPPEVAKLWGVSADKVLTWIRSGELRAINAATSQRGRPRYLIDVKDLEDFEARRTVLASGPEKKLKKRRNTTVRGVVKFF